MNRLLCLLLLASGPALAQGTAPAPLQPPPASAPAAIAPAAATKPAIVRVTLQTTAGPILLELEKERAPITTANFLRYVDEHRLDGTSFYRAVKVAPGYGLVQGGPRDMAKRLLPPIAHEPTTQTGLSHRNGTISMARNAPGTAAADFFIVIGDLVSMDADPKQPGDNLGFAAFGHVAQGIDVVHRILDAPTSPDAGAGVMKGQILLAPIRIVTARRTP